MRVDHFRFVLVFPVEKIALTTSWVVAESDSSPTMVVFDVVTVLAAALLWSPGLKDEEEGKKDTF